MKLGKEFFKEIPQLEVISQGRDEKENHTYYLSPFRAYGFQVSGTDDGIGSYGASEFIGLTNVVRQNSERIAKAIFRALAIDALTRHNRGNQAWYTNFEEENTLINFVDTSYDWVKSIVDKENEQIKKDVFGTFEFAVEKQEEENPKLIETIKSKLPTWKRKQA